MISNRLKAEEITEKVKIMCQALKHGGPDDEGVFCSESANLVFGHRRLSIIDLSKNGLADPLVDELASVPLDLWAQEHGYAKLHPNLLGM